MKFLYHDNMVWITSHLFNPEYKSTTVSLLNGEKKGYVSRQKSLEDLSLGILHDNYIIVNSRYLNYTCSL